MTAYFIYLIIGELLMLWMLKDENPQFNQYRNQVLTQQGPAKILTAVIFLWPLIIIIAIIQLTRDK